MGEWKQACCLCNLLSQALIRVAGSRINTDLCFLMENADTRVNSHNDLCRAYLYTHFAERRGEPTFSDTLGVTCACYVVLCRPSLSGKLHGALRNSKPIRNLWIPVVQHVTPRRVASLTATHHPKSTPSYSPNCLTVAIFVCVSLSAAFLLLLCSLGSRPVTFCDEFQ